MRGRGISKDQIIAPRPVEDGTRTRRETTGNTYIPSEPRSRFSYSILPLFTLIYALHLLLSPTLCLAFSRSSSIVCPMTGELALGEKKVVINEHSPFVLVVILHPKYLHTKRISMTEKYCSLSLFIIIDRYIWIDDSERKNYQNMFENLFIYFLKYISLLLLYDYHDDIYLFDKREAK